MDFARPLSVVASTLDGDVLALLAGADRAWTGREIERAIGGSHGGVRRALAHLVAQGVVVSQPAGRARLYSLNREHLASPWIEGLAALRLQLIARLREAIDAWTIPAVAASLFGSVARGDASAASDMDILVVRPETTSADDPRWRDQLRGLEAQARRWSGNDVRILEMGADEADSTREPALAEAAREGVPLVGSLPRTRRRE